MNKIIRKTLMTALTVLLLAGTLITAQARETVDLSRTDCSLTIEMHCGGRSIPGGSLTLYRVGDVVENGGDYGFRWLDELNCDVDMENIQSEEAAAQVMRCVKKQGLQGTTVDIGKNGKAVFDGLTVGLYLVEQKSSAEGYTKINPFLISLPQWEDDHYSYGVNAVAKAEMTRTPPTPPDTPKPEKPRTPRLPQTGQLNWPVPMLTTAGIAFLIAGSILRRRDRDA